MADITLADVKAFLEKMTVLEMADQVMPSLDPEMGVTVGEHLVANGVNLRLGDGVDDRREVVIRQHHVGRVLRGVGAVHAHGHSDVGLLERG